MFDEVEVYTAFDKWLAGFEGRPVFVSDNPAFDWQWINYGFITLWAVIRSGLAPVVSVISTPDYAETFTQNRTGNAFARRATIAIP